MSKTILAEVDGFTPVIDTMIPEVGLTTATVFGKVWRYCQMADGVCTAAQDRLADELGLSRPTINQHIEKLVTAGYLEDLTPGLLGKPHTFRDTGKAGLSISFTAKNEPVKNLDTTCKDSLQQPVKNLYSKIVVKRDSKIDINNKEIPKISPQEEKTLLVFTDRLGKFKSEKELKRWLALADAVGIDQAETIATWAEKREIHMDNRAGLMDSLETAAKNWKEKQQPKPRADPGSRADFFEKLARA
jgi:hypothetical protein